MTTGLIIGLLILAAQGVVAWVAYSVGQRVLTARYSTFLEVRELEAQRRGVTLNRVIIRR